MTSSNDFDRRLGAWLDEGPERAPDRTIDAALAHAQAHPRRRDPLAVLRRDPMSGGGFGGALRPLPLVAVLGLILVAAIGVATVGGFFSRPSVVPPPVTPTASPTAPAPTATPTGPAVPASSPAVVRVDLIDDIGGGAFVEITDQSGTMVDARSGERPKAPRSPATSASRTWRAIRTAVVLTWVGSPCDTRHVLTIAPDGRTMTVSRARARAIRWPSPACSSCASTARCRRARSSRLCRPAAADATGSGARGQARTASLPALERREEVDDRGRQPVRLLHPDHVRDVVPDDRPRIRGGRLEPARRLDDIGEVELPGDRQDGAAQLRQALVGRWLEADLAAADAPWLVERPGHRRGTGRGASGRTRSGGWPGPSSQTCVSKSVSASASNGSAESTALVLLEDRDFLGRRLDLEPAQAGGDADDGDDPLGRLDGRVEGDHPAARVADQRRPPDAERSRERRRTSARCENSTSSVVDAP